MQNTYTRERPPMDSLLTMDFIVSDCGYSRCWIYTQIKKGMFPPPKKMGNSSRWLAADYYRWRDESIKDSEKKFEVSRNIRRKNVMKRFERGQSQYDL